MNRRAVLLPLAGFFVLMCAGCAALLEEDKEDAEEAVGSKEVARTESPDARLGKSFWAVPDAEPGPFIRPRFVAQASSSESAAPFRPELFMVLGVLQCRSAQPCYEVRFGSGRIAYISAQNFIEAFDADPTAGRLSEGGLIALEHPSIIAQRVAEREAQRLSAARARGKALGAFSAIYEEGLGLAPAPAH
jgi:hypothetical protein